VQSYTHPLWLFLLTPLALFRANLFYGSIALSVLVSLGAVLILTRGIVRAPAAGALAIIVLIFSKSFIDYSTSGLENPLTHLLSVLFVVTLLRGEVDIERYRRLSLWAGLAVLNRMDTLLLFLPALLWGSFKLRSRQALGSLVLGFLPFILWEVFSLIYYGFPFPNTAYAKLNTGISSQDLFVQGLRYLQDCLTRDPLTLAIIVIGLVLPFLTRDRKAIMMALGVLLYLTYVVRNGGCFMAGRFLTAPLVCSIAVFASARWVQTRRVAFAVGAMVILAGLFSPYPPLLTGPGYGSRKAVWIDAKTGIADERGYYFNTCGLINAPHYPEMPAHLWAQVGRQLRGAGRKTLVFANIGLEAYFAGPDLHVVDPLALGDPLLARLPTVTPRSSWRIGHFVRRIPDGYLESLETGENLVTDKALAQYYGQLQLVVCGRLFSKERLIAIWRLNTGTDNNLLESYNSTAIPRVALADIPALAQGPGRHLPKLVSGLQVDLPGLSHDEVLQAVVDDRSMWAVLFCQGDTVLGQAALGPTRYVRQAPISWLTTAPRSATASGYDNVKIYLHEGDAHCTLTRLVLHPALTTQVTMDQCLENLRLRPDDPASHSSMGELLSSLGQPAESLPHFREAIRLLPDYLGAHINMGIALQTLGRHEEALRCFREALRLEANDADACNNIAWLRATCPNEALRSGAEAVKMATQACRLTENGNPNMLDTLAAAYAEAGRFKEATETANKAIALFRQAGREELTRATAERLQLYLKGQAFRDSAPAPTQPSSATTRSS